MAGVLTALNLASTELNVMLKPAEATRPLYFFSLLVLQTRKEDEIEFKP